MHLLVLIWTSLFMQSAAFPVAVTGHTADYTHQTHFFSGLLSVSTEAYRDQPFKGYKDAGTCAASPLQDDSTKNDPVSSDDDQSILVDDEDIPDFFTAHRLLPCIISAQHYLVSSVVTSCTVFYAQKQTRFSVSRKVEKVFRI